MTTKKQGKIVNIVSNAGAFRWPTCSSYSTSKAAIIKLTENLAVEVKQHNVDLFAYHPRLIHSDGMSINETTPPPEPGSTREKAFQWFLAERAAGRTVDAQTGAHPVKLLVSGKYHSLSGRYFTVFDNLDKLESEHEKIKNGDFRTLRIRE